MLMNEENMVYMRDKVTGFEGRVTAKAHYYDGNGIKILLEGLDTTGRPIEEWFPVERLETV